MGCWGQISNDVIIWSENIWGCFTASCYFFIDHIIVYKWTPKLIYTRAFKFLFFMFFSKLLYSNTSILDRFLLSHEQNFHKNLIPWKIKFCPMRKLHLKDNECIDSNINILITWTRCTYWICLSGYPSTILILIVSAIHAIICILIFNKMLVSDRVLLSIWDMGIC